MDINKAIRKQEKSHKRFLFFLGFIFFTMPLVVFLTRRYNLFFMIYLGIIELLILTAILATISSNYISYSSDDYKIKLKLKRFGEGFNIICDKVALVHAEGYGPDMSIIILMTSRFRNKKIDEVNEEFLKKYQYVSHHYYKIKKLNPESNYFYLVVKKGYYHKYRLLDMIYRNCVKAYYTEETVEKIKEYRRF
ncbi:hypothetical protein NBE98_15520 [Clostridium swellfunianum]|uniref:hypothetical protein n=1 Tax=Clostridium swellfunianum TaxID=1367462 RepID=UPI00202ECE68|nr:hypothetical protein [Clostridium swellfunianum]MCM0649775.1 hypothetical protein [Clostridium swellfunianum]